MRDPWSGLLLGHLRNVVGDHAHNLWGICAAHFPNQRLVLRRKGVRKDAGGGARAQPRARRPRGTHLVKQKQRLAGLALRELGERRDLGSIALREGQRGCERLGASPPSQRRSRALSHCPRVGGTVHSRRGGWAAHRPELHALLALLVVEVNPLVSRRHHLARPAPVLVRVNHWRSRGRTGSAGRWLARTRAGVT